MKKHKGWHFVTLLLLEIKMVQETKKTALVKLLYDVWDENEQRIEAGSVTSIELNFAKSLIKDGKAERADPMPE